MNPPPSVRPCPHAPLSPRDWLGKSSAGALLGFTLALALGGLLDLLTPGAVAPYNAKHQLIMWSMGLFWPVILALCFLFRDGRRAWLWLAAANLVAYGLFFGGRALLP